jgi:hypothetical protein
LNIIHSAQELERSVLGPDRDLVCAVFHRKRIPRQVRDIYSSLRVVGAVVQPKNGLYTLRWHAHPKASRGPEYLLAALVHTSSCQTSTIFDPRCADGSSGLHCQKDVLEVVTGSSTLCGEWWI